MKYIKEKGTQALYSQNTYIIIALVVILSTFSMYANAQNEVVYGKVASNQVTSPLTAVQDIIDPTPASAPEGETLASSEEVKLSSDTDTDSFVSEANTQEVIVNEPVEDTTLVQENPETSEPPQEVVFTDENTVTEETVSEEEEKSFFFTVPYSLTTFVDGEEWAPGYGGISFINGNLLLGNSNTDTASLVLLEGGYHFEDYKYTVNLDWHRGRSLSLVARFQDYENYVTCSFRTNGSGASIVSLVNGERTQGPSSTGFPVKQVDAWKDLTFGITVDGDVLGCTINDEFAVKATLDTMPKKGTVGIAAWAENPGEAFATIHEVSVVSPK